MVDSTLVLRIYLLYGWNFMNRAHTRWTRLVPTIAALAAGCATTSADFKMSRVGPDEAAIAGRITIIYNGNLFTENCSATFGGRKLELSRDGVVLFQVTKGWTSLERIDCKDGLNQHVRIRGAHFFARGDERVSDFGDVVVTWEARGGYKALPMLGAIGAMVDEGFDDGTASIEIRPPAAEVRAAFRRHAGADRSWTVQLLSRPRVPDQSDAPRAPGAGGMPAGFFCTSSSEGVDYVSVCERDQATCERVRARLAGHHLPACAPAQTAWCFVLDARLRCFETQMACEVRSRSIPILSDVCGEQY